MCASSTLLPPGEEKRFDDHANAVESVALSPTDDYLLSSSRPNRLVIRNLRTGAFDTISMASPIRDMLFVDDTKVLVACGAIETQVLSSDEVKFKDCVVRLLDVRTGQVLRMFTGHEGIVTGLAHSDEGTFISGSSDGSVRRWNIESGKQIGIAEHKKGVMAVATDRTSSRTYCGLNDGTLVSWGRLELPPVQEKKGTGNSVLSLHVSPDDSLLAIGSIKSAQLRDASSLNETFAFDRLQKSVFSVKFIDASRVITWSSNTIILWKKRP